MTWHHKEVPDDVPEVLEARQAYKKAEQDAILLRARARARLGRAVVEANQRGNSFEHIARELKVAVNQVQRYRQSYLDWQRDHPGESID